MEDIRAVVNRNGIVLYLNFMVDTEALVPFLRELGGVRPRAHEATRIPIEYGNGLTRNVAKAILTRRGVPFEETSPQDGRHE